MPSNTFQSLIKLKRLILTGICLERIGSNVFTGRAPGTGMEQMTTLNLSGLLFCADKIPNASFTGMTNLQVLDLSNNDLTEIDSGAFHGINNLNYLDIRNNKLGDLCTSEIVQVSESLLEGMYVGTLLTDDFRLCCSLNRSATTIIDYCSPTPDQFSSCDHLMDDKYLHILIWVIGAASLIGNCLVIFGRMIKYSLGVDDYFVLSLNISDLMMGVYVCIIATIDIYYRGGL